MKINVDIFQMHVIETAAYIIMKKNDSKNEILNRSVWHGNGNDNAKYV